MFGLEEAISRTLAHPEQVIQSASDPEARLYYRLENTRLGQKHVCVVVKAGPMDDFVLTAYLTDKPKKGRVLWHVK